MAEVATLRDELETAFDGDDGSVPVQTPVEGSPDVGVDVAQNDGVADPAAKPDRARDASGKFVKRSDDPPEAAQVPEAAQPGAADVAAAQESVDLAPSTWTPAAKAAYVALPAESPLRSEIKKREADYQKGISQYKQAAEAGGKLMAEIQPYLPMIQAEGGTPERAVKSLLNTAYQLRTGTPQERGALVMQIAHQYGADLSSFLARSEPAAQNSVQGIDPQAIQPVVQQLLQPVLQRVSQFENQFVGAQQRAQQEQQQATNASIEAFRTAADEKGAPQHPYFENVRMLMGDFIEKGHARTLDEAYAMACRAHPEVSRTVAAEQSRRQEAQRLEEAKRKAADASRANAVNASGQGGVGIAGATSSTLRGELETLFDQSHGARL